MKLNKKIAVGAISVIGLLFSCAYINTDKEVANVEQTTIEVSNTPTEVLSIDEKLPAIKFDTTTINFGTIKQNDVFECDFKFTNTGYADLVITSAKGSCGCTVPEWPREAIAPGDSANIHVKFNSRGKRNSQTKTVTLSTNASPTPVVLYIKGFVEVPATPTTK